MKNNRFILILLTLLGTSLLMGTSYGGDGVSISSDVELSIQGTTHFSYGGFSDDPVPRGWKQERRGDISHSEHWSNSFDSRLPSEYSALDGPAGTHYRFPSPRAYFKGISNLHRGFHQ